nr:nuclear transport factor 2 family protein [Rhodopseudomonas sp. BR0G17]
MTSEEFARLLESLTRAAESGDGARFANHFTEDATYHDYIYGPHTGRAEIAAMMQDLFHRDAADYRWEMFDPVCNGDLGYAWSLSSFTSTVPDFAGQRVVIDGISRFVLRGALIAEYHESVNGGVAMAQLGVAPERMAKVFRKWSGWLQQRPETQDYVARPKGSRRARHLSPTAGDDAHDAGYAPNNNQQREKRR